MSDVDLMREEIAMLEMQNRRQCEYVRQLRGSLSLMIGSAEINDPTCPHLHDARTAMSATTCGDKTL